MKYSWVKPWQWIGRSEIICCFLNILTPSLYSFKICNCLLSRCKNKLRNSIFNFNSSFCGDDCSKWHHIQDFSCLRELRNIWQCPSCLKEFCSIFTCFHLPWQEHTLTMRQSVLCTYTTINSIIKYLFSVIFYLIINKQVVIKLFDDLW